MVRNDYDLIFFYVLPLYMWPHSHNRKVSATNIDVVVSVADIAAANSM